ncbi:transposase [Actinospica durhamensis]|uniref:Transposase n=1 Tax=Actinospica durhamensis TaxID=1508375 RepID=A0A941ETR3_9ACTN|nr:transposase [Actinospica durhamensis]MBR7836257.1 transposase [Actinospica durhamensis]
MKHYPPQFKADAVALYHSRPGASAAQVARDPGIYPAMLLAWIKAADGPGEGVRDAVEPEPSAASSVEAENRALRRRVAELEEEREILRQAAKYFAGETKW